MQSRHLHCVLIVGVESVGLRRRPAAEGGTGRPAGIILPLSQPPQNLKTITLYFWRKTTSLLLTHCCLAPCKSVTNYCPLTEPKFYIVKSGRTQIPTSNGHISETKRGILDPLVPKFFSRRGLSSPLSWKWANVTLSPSFGLFQSEKPLFRGVPEGTHGHSLARICPQLPFPRKKKITWPPILWQAV